MSPRKRRRQVYTWKAWQFYEYNSFRVAVTYFGEELMKELEHLEEVDEDDIVQALNRMIADGRLTQVTR